MEERSGNAVCSLSSTVLEFRNLFSQNETDRITQPAALSIKMRRTEALWKSINIQQEQQEIHAQIGTYLWLKIII
jgi:hypothetical protein